MGWPVVNSFSGLKGTAARKASIARLSIQPTLVRSQAPSPYPFPLLPRARGGGTQELVLTNESKLATAETHTAEEALRRNRRQGQWRFSGCYLPMRSMMLISGRNKLMTMKPTVKPMQMMSNGSKRLIKAPTTVSTSAS
jgi:hypothetical protein